jgi:hypothetical protein
MTQEAHMSQVQHFLSLHRRAEQSMPLEAIKRLKVKLAVDIGQANSIRDFGGLWGVLGLYLLEGAKGLQCHYAEMIDVTPREEFVVKAKELESATGCQVKMTRADFRYPQAYEALEPVDVSLLYEVLLHQDNFPEVIRNVTAKTRKTICVAQPVLKEEICLLPNGCVNLQFYPEELKDLIRPPDWWPKESPANRFVTNKWMWGQTASLLDSVFYGYGWGLDFLDTYHLSPYWDYALMRFVPRV